MYINDAWVAGFMEGDGCFSYQISNYKYRYPKIEIHQKNLEPLEKVKELYDISLNVGKIGRVWTAGGKAHDIYSRIAPYLSSKRIAQAEAQGFSFDGEKLLHDISWLAGYYEAEGCFHTKSNGQIRKDGSKKLFAGLTISQYYSEETSKFCVEAAGGGRVAGPYMAYGERRAYSYNLAGLRAFALVEAMAPMLSQEKLAQVERVKDKLV